MQKQSIVSCYIDGSGEYLKASVTRVIMRSCLHWFAVLQQESSTCREGRREGVESQTFFDASAFSPVIFISAKNSPIATLDIYSG